MCNAEREEERLRRKERRREDGAEGGHCCRLISKKSVEKEEIVYKKFCRGKKYRLMGKRRKEVEGEMSRIKMAPRYYKN